MIAVEKDFYKLEKLTQADKYMIKKIFSESLPEAQRKYHYLIKTLMLPFDILENSEDDRLKGELEIYRLEVLENFHSQVEARFIPLLSLALQGDLSFYGDSRCIVFLDYITKQYMRTKGIKERIYERSKPFGGVDIRRAWNLMSLMFAENLGASLYSERKHRELVLLINESNLPFITGDQPVINLEAMGEETVNLVLFYPLSPKYALWLGGVNERCPYIGGIVTEDDVKKLNRKIFDASYKQIFSNKSIALELFV